MRGSHRPVALLALSSLLMTVACGSSGDGGNTGRGGAAGSGLAGHGGTTGSAGAGGNGAHGGTTGSAGNSGTGGAAGGAGATGVAGHGGTTGAAGNGGVAGTGGMAGAQGAAGHGGSTGAAGTGGTAGSAGSAGSAGAAGHAGATGTAGSGGTAGAAGSAGVGGATTGSAGSGGTAGAGGAGGAAATLSCGSSPLQTFTVQTFTTGTAPPFMNLTSSICTGGTHIAVPLTAGGVGAMGSAMVSLGEVAQYLTATASDDSTYPTLTYEFIPGAAFATAPTQIPAWAKTLNPFAAPGFGTTGSAMISVFIAKTSSAAAPCNATSGVTIALDTASATAHPEAMIYYDQGGSVWSTTGPTVGGNSAAVVLTPGSATDFVQIVATKSGCTVDTAAAPGPARTLGLTGRIPVMANSVSLAQAKVGP